MIKKILWKLIWEIRGKIFKDELRATARIISKDKFELIIKDIKYKMNLNKNDKLLDYGCGKGFMSAKLSEFVLQIDGIDNSTRMIIDAKDGKYLY
ncbi:hypothetical protein J7L48_09140 [bacterium]|nr:hypothetical protein [bacterium]